MAHLRKDPFGMTWVIISPERGLAPSDFGSVRPGTSNSPLSPGNETAFRELRALRPTSSPHNASDWRVRIIESPQALLEAKPFEVGGHPLFTSANGSGYQEVIIEHPDARMLFEHMPSDHLREVLMLYRDRLGFLATKPGVKHIQLTRNVGKVAGAMFDHPHAQLLAMPVNNRWLDEEITAASAYHETQGRCLFCDVLGEELVFRERLISYNEHFVAFCPYASKTPFETWIIPRQHGSSFTSLAGNMLSHLGELLQSIIGAMNDALNYPPYNLIVHTLPIEADSKYHWHIELLPRLTRQAGFDWSSGFYVNPTPPEDAARFLKEALALQGVGM